MWQQRVRFLREAHHMIRLVRWPLRKSSAPWRRLQRIDAHIYDSKCILMNVFPSKTVTLMNFGGLVVCSMVAPPTKRRSESDDEMQTDGLK